MKIQDSVFGAMSYDYQWEKSEDLSLWGEQYHIQIIAQSSSDDETEISQIQRDSYLQFKERFASLADSGLQELIAYCRNTLEIANCDIETFRKNNKPSSVFFAVTGEWGILFESEFDPEDGIALMFSEERWVVGPQDILI